MKNRNITLSCKANASQKESYQRKAEQEGLSLSEWIVTVLDLYLEKNPTKKEPFKHKFQSIPIEEILANRSKAYKFIDFDEDVNPLNIKKAEMQKLHNKIINCQESNNRSKVKKKAIKIKPIDYLILGCIIAVIGLLITNASNDLRFLLISFVGILLCIIAIVKNDQQTQF
jgi:hypothetical protein